jgi:hypothetical protein
MTDEMNANKKKKTKSIKKSAGIEEYKFDDSTIHSSQEG